MNTSAGRGFHEISASASADFSALRGTTITGKRPASTNDLDTEPTRATRKGP